jgi:AraC-like DNA-binding protein
MILFDSAPVPVASRRDALQRALLDVTVPTTLILEESSGRPLTCRMDYWALGSAEVIATRGTGFTMRRNRHHLKAEGPPFVALSVQTAGTGHFEHLETRRRMEPGSMMLVDLTCPYEFGWTGHGGNQGLQVSYDILGLAPDVVRRAGGRLEASPLAGLLRHHLAFVRSRGDALGPGSGAPLGAATVDLLRALIASVAGDDALARTVAAETLTARVLAYLHRHLTEPDLKPDRIAREHGICVRQLYKLCEREGIQLEQWIIGQRLERARAGLVAPSTRQRTIGAIARSWGFRDSSHFSRRFRAAYGMSPREWQLSYERGQGPGRSFTHRPAGS